VKTYKHNIRQKPARTVIRTRRLWAGLCYLDDGWILLMAGPG